NRPVKETPLNEVPAGREAFPTPVTPRVSWPKRDPGASTNASVRTLIVIEIVCRFMAVSPLKESSVPLYDVSASDRRRCTTRCRCVRIRNLDLEPVTRIAVVRHGYGEVVWTSPATTSCAFHTGPCDNGCIAGDGQRSDAAAVVSKAVHVVVVLHRPAECTVRRSHYFESEPGGTVEDVDIAAASPLCGNRCITRCHGHRRRRGAVSCSIPSYGCERV